MRTEKTVKTVEPTNPDCGICRRQPGRCINHDVDLSARNRKVTRNRMAKDPELFRAQCVAAGKAGFQATLNRHGRSKALEVLRERRLKKPSVPEQALMDMLDELLFVYEREVWVDDTHTVDFVARGDSIMFYREIWIEVDGRPWMTREKQEQRDLSFAHKRSLAHQRGALFLKLDYLEIDIWPMLLYNVRKDAHQEEINEFNQ